MISFSFVVLAQYLLASAEYVNQVKDLIYWPDNPEEKIVTLPKGDDVFPYERNTAGAESLGSLIAGLADFPFLVDIQLSRHTQEDWTIGNLISAKNVLTSCRWSTFYLKLSKELDIDWKTSEDIRWQYNSEDLLVFYCPLLVHDYRESPWISVWRKTPNDKDYVGSRSVKFVSTHPQCEDDPINFDFSIMTLSRSIPPILPYIAYMPIRIERSNLLITDFDLSTHEEKRIVCYVGSFGRNYKNWQEHIAVGYKVKYRVYYEDWGTCATHYVKYRCPPNEEDQPHAPGAFHEVHQCPGEIVSERVDKDTFAQGFDNLMCFNSRARNGAICDHDSGAPLVCDGYVYGMVVRAAHFTYCNNLLPVPFIVSKITPAADYYLNLARKPYSFSLLVDPENFPGRRSFARDLQPVAISVLLSVTMCLIYFYF